MINITNPVYDSSIENNTPQEETVQSPVDIVETETIGISNLTQNNNIRYNASEILSRPPTIYRSPRRSQTLSSASILDIPVSENYIIGPPRRTTFNRYREFYLRNTIGTTNANANANDIEDSYEELTRLGNRLGNVSVGIKKLENICKEYILEEEDECFVCREEFIKGDKMKKLLCNHYFCEECIGGWFKDNKKCPICMVEYNNEGLNKPNTTKLVCETSTYV